MIYSNITSGDFKYYKEKLKQIEKNIEAVSTLNGFVVDRERYYAAALAINLNRTDNENLGGNICFQYLDRQGPVKFSLGLVKSQDRRGYRYFKKKSIYDECTIDFFE